MRRVVAAQHKTAEWSLWDIEDTNSANPTSAQYVPVVTQEPKNVRLWILEVSEAGTVWGKAERANVDVVGCYTSDDRIIDDDSSTACIRLYKIVKTKSPVSARAETDLSCQGKLI